MNELNISNNGASIKFSDVTSTTPDSYIPKVQIRRISGTFMKNSGGLGKSPSMLNRTVLHLELGDGTVISQELQLVRNQATWNLGTLAALNQATSDINSWL